MSHDELNEALGPSLGTDPFTQGDGTLPYLIRLRERSLRIVAEAVPTRAAQTTAYEEPQEPPDLGPPIPELPTFDDRDESAGALDRLAGMLLTPSDEDRLAQLGALLGGRPYDEFGLSPRVTRRALAFFKLLYKYWFRVESSGHAVLPEKEGAILAANHGGLLPFDATMIVCDGVLAAKPPRLVRTVVDRWAGTLPFVNVFYARVGQVVGSRDNVRELLRLKQLVLIFPEGMAGIRKRAADRYVLQPFHLGFVEESLRHRVPIVPVAVVGADDQAPVLWDLQPLAKLLGLPFFPITPTFPLLGPLGLLPYPVRYEIAYGEPFRFYDEYPPEALEDPHAVRYMTEQVRRRIQEMVDQRVLDRRAKRR
jgi:1-acyl-sn-glycerol-3-phosphate acyltransferase